MTLTQILVRSLFLAAAVALITITIGTVLPTVEVHLDRSGACVVVTDLTTGDRHDCGWERGRRYMTSY